MTINYDNIHQAIAALNQCAKENENRQTDTGAVRVSNLCTDVACFLSKVRQDYKQWQGTKDGKVRFVEPNDTATQPPCDMKFHDGVVVEIDGKRHVLEPVEDTGRNGSCSQCSLDEVCDRFKNALCNGLAGYDDDHIFVLQE